MSKNKKYKLIDVIIFIWSYVRKHKRLFYTILFLGVGISLIEVSTPYIWGKIIDSFLGKKLIFGLNINQILIFWIFLIICKIIFNRIRSIKVVHLEMNVEKNLVKDLTSHILKIPVKYFYDRKPGEIYKRIDRAGNIGFIIQSFFHGFAGSILLIFTSLIVMLSINWILALINIVVIIFFLLFATIYKMQKILAMRKKINNKYNEIYGAIGDFVGNIFTVKINSAENYEIKNLDIEYNKAVDIVKKDINLWTKVNLGQGFISNFGIVSTILVGSYFLTNQIITPGDFVAFLVFIPMIYRPLWWMSEQYRTLKRVMVDIVEAQKLLNVPIEKSNYKDENDIEINGEIEFKNVFFNYSGKDYGILKNLSFKVKKGDTLAIFGETGSGKTTIYNLILRLYEHESGQIFFNKIDSRKINRHSLRSQIAVVPQAPALFNESILDNIKYGRQEASLPKGYKTKVGERGVKLSGGQVQRIAIARAALRNPKILILDEATTSLDQKTKFEVLGALQNLIKGRTTIIITHDFSAITQSADNIIVLDKGKIVQQGKHNTLVNQKGVYRELWQTQQKHLQ